jgi:hypothetical protein
VSKIQEYDLDIKPTKLIKGQGFSQMMAEGNEVSLGMKEGSSPLISTMLEELEHHDWYSDIIYYLKNLTSLNRLTYHKRSALRLKASKLCFINQCLGWRNLNGLILGA